MTDTRAIAERIVDRLLNGKYGVGTSLKAHKTGRTFPVGSLTRGEAIVVVQAELDREVQDAK